jgi:hypothetical protein|tara:strand:+ start:70 stop:288 length:219 start_codon:yes stop_codon:yes gene_type:complete
VNHYLVFVYGVCFSLIAGGAFALMWSNVQSVNKMMDEPPKPRHPEAPQPGEEIMYVDLSRERLEELYSEDDL